MKLKSFSNEEKVLVAEDDNGIVHELPFDFIDWLVRLLVRVGYIEIVQHKPDVVATHKWAGRLTKDSEVLKKNE